MRCARSFISFVLVLSGVVGCASKRAPLPPPLATMDRSIYSGSALSGPTTRPVSATTAGQTLIISFELRALDASPAILNPIGPDVRLIVSSRSDGAIQPRARLTRDVRWQSGAQVPATKARAVSMLSDEVAIPAGASAVLSVADQNDLAHSFRIAMTQPPSKSPEVDLALTITGKAGGDDGLPAGEPIEETAVLKPVSISEPTTLAVLIPFTFAKSEVRSVLAILSARPATDNADDAKLLAAANAEINRSISAAGAAPPSAVSPRWTGYEVAMAGLDDPQTRRASLLFLCRQTHALICQDLALSASDETLDAVAKLIQQKASDPKVPHDDASLAWLLDSGALRFAADLQTKDHCPPELLTLLIRHAGQAGMNSGSVAEILANEKTREGFEAHVMSENLIYLEDSSPAARVRAYDWLAARGKAPAGYNPLGTPRECEAALEKMYESMSQQASQNGGRR